MAARQTQPRRWFPSQRAQAKAWQSTAESLGRALLPLGIRAIWRQCRGRVVCHLATEGILHQVLAFIHHLDPKHQLSSD